MMPLPLPDALPPLDRAGGQPPSTDAILGRLQVLTMHHHPAALLPSWNASARLPWGFSQSCTCYKAFCLVMLGFRNIFNRGTS